MADAVGTRPVLLAAIVAAALGALLFALATGPAWLFAARIVQGLAVGAASGPLTTALTRLEPGGSASRAALVSTVASVGGLGLGPLLAGGLAQYGPAPTVLPFAVEILLLAPAAVAVAIAPTPGPATRWRPRRPRIPAEARGAFAGSATSAFLAFAVTGLFLTLVPTYVATLARTSDLLIEGAAVALMLTCSAAAQLAGTGRSPRTLELLGLPLLATGLALLALAGGLSSPVPLVAAIATAGAGQGLVFLAGLTAVNQAAPADRRSEVLSGFYVVVYLGVSVPVIGVGLLATVAGPVVAVGAAAGVVAVLCLAVLGVRVRARQVPELRRP
jgi:hypothetical protein